MMQTATTFGGWVGIGVVLIVVLAIAAGVYLFKTFNSPDGERYLRQRTQGPFVPRDGE
jgi:hypothetical protein